MADLRSIMNADEEHHDARVNKRDRDPSSPSPRLSRQSHPSPAPHPHSTSSIPGPHQQQPHTLQPHPHSQQRSYYRDPHAPMDPSFVHYDRRVSPYAQPSPMPAEDFSSTSSSSRISSGHQPMPSTAYRGSNTPDELDHQGFSYSHHVGVSSSLASPSMRAPTSMRTFNGVPMENQAGNTPLKYTPVTGRVSKALKGVPVHTCHDCVPPRTFSRNEHLKRHQLSHKNPAYVCKLPGCGRKFHRKDLLDRHEQKHGLEKEATPRRGSQQSSGRRPPSSSGLDLVRSSIPARLGPLPYSAPQDQSSPLFSTTFMSESTSQSPTTPRGNKRRREPDTFDPSTISPRTIATTESYQTSTQSQAFNSTYVFSSPSSPPMPLVQEHMHGVYDRSPRRPSLHTKFIPSADNPPDLLPAQDPAGIPSSASSTSYSPASEFSRNRSHLTSPGVDWADARFFASSFPAPSIDMISVTLDAGAPPVTSAAVSSSPISQDTLVYPYPGSGTGLFVADTRYGELPAPKRRFTRQE